MSQVSLVDMKPGQSGVIAAIAGGQGLKSKLQALGFRPAKKVTKLSSVFRLWAGYHKHRQLSSSNGLRKGYYYSSFLTLSLN